MRTWTRTAPFERRSPVRKERWELCEDSERRLSFDVEVTIGKPLDIMRLKGQSVDEIREYATYLDDTARLLYFSGRDFRNLEECPCCGHCTATAAEVFRAFSVPYHGCSECGHVFIRRQPAIKALNEVFAKSEVHSSTYIDRESLEVRLSQVIKPKLDWVIDKYRGLYKRPIKNLLDVGAGGGHFVAVCRREGFEAEGYEISRASRNFAQQALGVDLKDVDFLMTSNANPSLDAITFWGLLEYTPEPLSFLKKAARLLNGQGMLIVEVPRFECISSAMQMGSSATIARHMDPTSHVNCFTDASLVTALIRAGFRPVAAWFFGMDAYELLVQAALKLKDEKAMSRLADMIGELQACFDSAQICDDIVIAAIPMEPNQQELFERGKL